MNGVWQYVDGSLAEDEDILWADGMPYPDAGYDCGLMYVNSMSRSNLETENRSCDNDYYTALCEIKC